MTNDELLKLADFLNSIPPDKFDQNDWKTPPKNSPRKNWVGRVLDYIKNLWRGE